MMVVKDIMAEALDFTEVEAEAEQVAQDQIAELHPLLEMVGQVLHQA
jgi:hypothetical protein|tara:strand:- start:165 stop:305 length:141 start_codon:yes stop_codon:yes gene_type:complete